MNRILVLGAGGQLGMELVEELRKRYGTENVFASDLKPQNQTLLASPFIQIDALNIDTLRQAVIDNEITQIYHLAAILSARGEDNPLFAWDVNMKSLLNVLEIGRHQNLDRIYWPSSIAVFGPDTPKNNTGQEAITNPVTTYGISKLAGEKWCNYYFHRYGLDVRSLRYPGLIGYKTPAGGGTTDYAVDIYQKAVRGENFVSFLESDSALPMMYMNDAVKATVDLMESPKSSIRIRSSYNISAMSFTPAEIHKEITTHFPSFQISYHPDQRQQIADGWPKSINDDAARNDWGWQHNFDLQKMTKDIIENLSIKEKTQ